MPVFLEKIVNRLKITVDKESEEETDEKGN